MSRIAALDFLIEAARREAASAEPDLAEGLLWMAEEMERRRTKLLRWPGGRPNQERLRNIYWLLEKPAASLNGDQQRTLTAAVRDGLLLIDAAGAIQAGPHLDTMRAAAAARWSNKGRPVKQEGPPWKSYEP